MSGTTIITQSQSAIGHRRVPSEGLDTAMTNVIPPERGITNVTRLMIEAAPALEVPEGYRDCIVVGPQDMWKGMLGLHWSFRYPFQGEERPTWAQFLEAMRLVIAEETNARLLMAEAVVARVEQQATAQIAVISEANRYMSHGMQSLSHRVEELAREAPDPMDIDTEALTIIHRAVPAPPSFAHTIQMMMINGKLTLSKKKGKGVEKPKKKKKTPAPTRAPNPSLGAMAPPASSASSMATSATDTTGASDRTERPGEQQTHQSTGVGQGSSLVLPIGRVANLGTTDRPSLPFPETPGRPTAAQEATAALSGECPQTAIGPGPFAGQGPAQPVPLGTDPAPNIFVQAQAEEWQHLATERGQQALEGSATLTVTCARCKGEGHFSDTCPQPPVCHLCRTTGHEAIDCTMGCKKCGTLRCLELCVNCLVEHRHLYNCPRRPRQRRRCAVCGSRNHLELTDTRCERHPRP